MEAFQKAFSRSSLLCAGRVMTIETGLQSNHDMLLILKMTPQMRSRSSRSNGGGNYCSTNSSFSFGLFFSEPQVLPESRDHFIALLCRDSLTTMSIPQQASADPLTVYLSHLHFSVIHQSANILHQIPVSASPLSTFFELPHQIIEGRLVCHFPDHEPRLLPVLPGSSPFVPLLPTLSMASSSYNSSPNSSTSSSSRPA